MEKKIEVKSIMRVLCLTVVIVLSFCVLKIYIVIGNNSVSCYAILIS
jgi:hypothetical protein